MKKLIMAILLIMATATAAHAAFDKYTIDRSNLPQAAQDMLQEYFPKAKVSMIKIDKHLLKKTDYDVKLVNGTKIEFNNAGKWTSVDCKTREVPQGL
ncbi:PepSY-like domain-containing protein, partial [uncultured Muribaculum sp.]